MLLVRGEERKGERETACSLQTGRLHVQGATGRLKGEEMRNEKGVKGDITAEPQVDEKEPKVSLLLL